MISSKCSVSGCKRDFDALCAHCQSNVCSKHYVEHLKLTNAELLPLSDELNSIINAMQQNDPARSAFDQLEQWRTECHRRIDELYDEKKQQLKTEIGQKVNEVMKRVRELSQEVKELIDEGDASFKQIENIKKSIEECRNQCKQFEKTDHFRLHMVPIKCKVIMMRNELFTGDGTLLSREHQIKLNKFYGKEGQKWSLIYKATRDGFSSADFHRYCDNQGATMTVIQSKDGGYLFGGYTSVSWQSSNTRIHDRNGPFLFTLTNPHKLPPTKYSVMFPQYAVYDSATHGPIFGGGNDLFVSNNSQVTVSSCFRFPNSYRDTTNRGELTFTGSKEFQTSEIEMYRLMQPEELT